MMDSGGIMTKEKGDRIIDGRKDAAWIQKSR